MRIFYLRRFKLIRGLVLIFVGYCFGLAWKNGLKSNLIDVQTIDIGFLTDGANIADMSKAVKTLFLHRQPYDYLRFHILAPALYWPMIHEIYREWSAVESGLSKSFNYSLYDIEECEPIINLFQPYFDSTYRIAFCKLIFPYLLDPRQVPHLLLLDFDIIILSDRFTSECWLKTITDLERQPSALFSIGHQGSPKQSKLPFPMPYLKEYKAHFHFNNGVVLFHVARIHGLDIASESGVYPISAGSRKWLIDVQQVALNYVRNCSQKYSLTQIIWNIYMASRPESFVQLNQGCNFQPCAQRTNVQMSDPIERFPTIIIAHLWRACLQSKLVQNDFFNSYREALSNLPVNYINRINPTSLS